MTRTSCEYEGDNGTCKVMDKYLKKRFNLYTCDAEKGLEYLCSIKWLEDYKTGKDMARMSCDDI